MPEDGAMLRMCTNVNELPAYLWRSQKIKLRRSDREDMRLNEYELTTRLSVEIRYKQMPIENYDRLAGRNLPRIRGIDIPG